MIGSHESITPLDPNLFLAMEKNGDLFLRNPIRFVIAFSKSNLTITLFFFLLM